MARMTLEELRKLREEKQEALEKRSIEGKDFRIIIGMGTCGIAAGAKETLASFLSVLDEEKIKHVAITQTGCMGLCHVEPTVEVILPDMPPVIYGNVDADVARTIVKEHILGRRLVTDHMYDRPAIDIITQGGGR